MTTTGDAESTTLIGWWRPEGSTGATSLTANNPWVTAGTIAGDCSTTDVDKCTKLATNCIGTKIFYRDGSIDDCPEDFFCTDFKLFRASPTASPSATNYACRKIWPAETIWAESPVWDMTSAEPSSTEPSTSSHQVSSTASSDQISSISSTSTSDATTPNASTQPSDPQGPSLPVSAIAGIAIGIVAIIALFVAGAFVYRRRQNKKRASAPGPPQNLPPGYYYIPELGQAHGVSELPTEKSAYPYPGPYELPGHMRFQQGGSRASKVSMHEQRWELE